MTSQHPIKAEVAGENNEYTIHSRMEILHILRAIQSGNELVTLYYGPGQDFILSSILGVDADHGGLLTLDYGADETQNKRLLGSERITLVTRQEHIKVQFSVDGVEKTEYLGRPAFKTGIPDELMKLQRREYYRIFTPMVKTIKCAMARPEGGRVEATVVNISLGGVAISDYRDQTNLNIGDRFIDCRIELPEIGTVNPDMEIRSEHEVTLRSGAKTRLAGCMFINLPPRQENMIQRYIINLERNRLGKLAQ